MSAVITKELAEKAERQFASLLAEIVVFIINSCWPSNIGRQFEKINELLEAAKKLGVSSVQASTPFTAEEINELVEELSPLRQLKMDEDVRPVVRRAFESHNLPRNLVSGAEFL